MSEKPATFAAIVERFEQADELLADPSFDPAAAIGELKDKVDRLFYFDDWIKTRHAAIQAIATSYQKTATALKKNHDRFRAYCAETMSRAGALEYPGNEKRINLQGGQPIPASLEIKIPADEQAHIKYPELCKAQIQIAYVWDHEALKAAFEGGKLPSEVAEMGTEGKTKEFIKFYNNAKPKPKAIKGKVKK